ncbi:large ribosomal subunit protein uL18m [Cydia pomonella]|uniref:large ribosomal subunit protein uL18m n=1 Tax=Cydia pomonella TaxID=82600 RepID=UPI002ADD893F|nr:large ribosomal subunit protein uL18m [Cydia pomonella]
MNSIRKLCLVPPFARNASSAAAEFVNRNPRNLERIRIARKPDGYHLDNPGRKFWHKLILTSSNRSITAQLVHYLNGPVIEVKSSDWALQKQLYSTKDMCAYISVGQVFAQRCLEAGISEMYCDIQATKGGKIERLIKEVQNGGIKLKEPEVYKKPYPWDKHRPEKPWSVIEE